MAIKLPFNNRVNTMIAQLFFIVGSLEVHRWFVLRFGESDIYLKYLFFIGIMMMYIGLDMLNPQGGAFR